MAEERARRNVAAILSALERVGADKPARAIGLDPSMLSKWKDRTAGKRQAPDGTPLSEIESHARYLAELGLKVVPETMRCYPETEIEAIFQLARARMKEMSTSRELAREHEWEEGV